MLAALIVGLGVWGIPAWADMPPVLAELDALRAELQKAVDGQKFEEVASLASGVRDVAIRIKDKPGVEDPEISRSIAGAAQEAKVHSDMLEKTAQSKNSGHTRYAYRLLTESIDAIGNYYRTKPKPKPEPPVQMKPEPKPAPAADTTITTGDSDTAIRADTALRRAKSAVPSDTAAKPADQAIKKETPPPTEKKSTAAPAKPKKAAPSKGAETKKPETKKK